MINKSKNNKIVTYRKEKKLLFLIFYKQDMYSPLPDTKFAVEIFEYNFKLWTNAISSTARSCRISLGPPILSHPYVGFALVLADLKFGIEAARHKGETIRKSRAIRRSANKIIDYLCWILVATSFGEAFGTPFGIPILPALVLLVVYGCEINSCFNNYFEARGSKLRINIFKWLKNKSDIMVPSDDENDTTKT